jgi:hypothetical protein
MFIAHHQEVLTMYVQLMVRVIRLGDAAGRVRMEQFHNDPASNRLT